MKKIFGFFFCLSCMQTYLFASIADDLTSEIISNNLQGIINTIDGAAAAAIPLTQMLAYAQTALNATAASSSGAPYDNAARRYLYDFSLRPASPPSGSTVLWVDQSLFLTGQIGANANVIMTSDRLIFPTIRKRLT